MILQSIGDIVSDETTVVVEKNRQITRRTIVCEEVKTVEDLQAEVSKIDTQIADLQVKKAELAATF